MRTVDETKSKNKDKKEQRDDHKIIVKEWGINYLAVRLT